MTLEERFKIHERNIQMIERTNIPYEAYDNSQTEETGIAFPIANSEYLLLMHMSTQDKETQTTYGYQFFTRKDLARDGWK